MRRITSETKLSEVHLPTSEYQMLQRLYASGREGIYPSNAGDMATLRKLAVKGMVVRYRYGGAGYWKLSPFGLKFILVREAEALKRRLEEDSLQLAKEAELFCGV